MPDFEVLIIGGGVAGLRAAIAAKKAGASVALVSKVHPLRTNSAVTAGGLNAPMSGDDSVADFAQDILAVGEGLSDSPVVNLFTREARDEVIWLDRMGVPFTRDDTGKLALRRFGANRHSRACYADDLTGHIVLQVVYEQFQRERIQLFSDTFVTSLALDNNGCVGVTAMQLRFGNLDLFSARAVILATGGFTRLYQPSTASIGTTGDGHSLAYLAGARMMDMEMIQFHPTVFPGRQGLLITEAALGEGAEIVNQNGQPIIQTRFESREKLSRSIHQALQNGTRSASLDLRPLGKDKLSKRFPQTCELVREVAQIDITKESVPIYPAAHRTVGGIQTDADGRTSIEGLFAVGECACNGVNGAGLLSGNVLTEGLVFGRKVGEAAAAYARSTTRRTSPTTLVDDQRRRLSSVSGVSNSTDTPLKIYAELAGLMNDKAGLVRDNSSLTAALAEIHALKARYDRIRLKDTLRIYDYQLTSCLEVGSLLNVAELVAMAGLARTESRGAHYRSDFPSRNDQEWNRHSIVSRANGEPKLDHKPAVAR